jgi:transcriptional regulator with XRE-family HTH domain
LAVGVKKLNKPEPRSNFQINLRRLLFLHHDSARDASAVIGVTEQAVSGWLRGKRKQTLDTLMRVAVIYEIDPRDLDADPRDFLAVLADTSRYDIAEGNIESLRKGDDIFKKPPTRKKATVTKLDDRRRG